MLKLKQLSSALLLVLSFSSAVNAGDLFRQRAVVLGGNVCSVPVQSFSSPVFSYSAPAVKSAVVVDSHSSVVQNNNYDYGDNDIATALRIITDFKLKQQTLEQGLSQLGYAAPQPQYVQPQGQPQYQQPAAVNFGLAPYEQGTTQYQVETFEYSAFGNNIADIEEQLNSLMRLSENMQKNSATVSASVGNTVQSLADGAVEQAKANVEVARIQSEAAARVAMLRAAKEVLEGSQLNSKVDVRSETRVEVPAATQPPVTVDQPQILSVPQTTTVVDPGMLLKDHCGKCHSGDATKGNFSLDHVLSAADVDRAVASVFSREMPKGIEQPLTVPEMLEIAKAIHELQE